MQLAFKIEDVRLLKVSYFPFSSVIDKSKSGEENKIDVNIKGSSHYHQKDNRLEIIINVVLKDKDSGYSLEVEYGAFFAFDGKPDKKELERIGKINGPAILFPYVREFISDVTRRAGHDSVNLPAVNFVQSGEAAGQ